MAAYSAAISCASTAQIVVFRFTCGAISIHTVWCASIREFCAAQSRQVVQRISGTGPMRCTRGYVRGFEGAVIV